MPLRVGSPALKLRSSRPSAGQIQPLDPRDAGGDDGAGEGAVSGAGFRSATVGSAARGGGAACAVDGELLSDPALVGGTRVTGLGDDRVTGAAGTVLLRLEGARTPAVVTFGELGGCLSLTT